MTRRYPSLQHTRGNRMAQVPLAHADDMNPFTQYQFPDNVGLECNPNSHALQACTCGERENDQLPEKESLSHQQAQTFVPTGDVAGRTYGAPRHSVTAFSACHYGPYGSSDSLPLSSPGVPGFNPGAQLPFRTVANAHLHEFGGSTPISSRHSLSEDYLTHPAYLMSDINGQGSSGDAPLLGSPSPDDSSDGTASPPTPTGNSAGRQYGPHRDSHRDSRDGRQITFPDLELDLDLKSNGDVVTPNIHASIERNIFFHDSQWTCYRRNYIFLQCHYSLTPCIPGAPLYVELGGSEGKKMVQALGVSLSATLNGTNDGKDVGLVQHTPKRDKGPQSEVGVEKLGPSPPGPNVPPYHGSTAANGPHLPLQAIDSDRSASMPPSGQHTFERIQFKQATANNGRRRAAQQFYHLSVELHADIRKDAKAAPKWVRIAHRISEPMVVRGRSPGHYKENKTGSSSGSSGGGSMGGGYGPGANFGFTGGPGSGRAAFLPLSSQNHGAMGGGASGYNTRHFISTPLMTPSMNSSTITSPNKAFMKQRNDSITSAEESFLFDSEHSHRIFPSGMYDVHGQNSLRSAVKLETGTMNAGPGPFNVSDYASAWHVPNCGRLGSVETSPAFYQSVGASF